MADNNYLAGLYEILLRRQDPNDQTEWADVVDFMNNHGGNYNREFVRKAWPLLSIIAGEFCGNEFNVYPQSGHQGSFNIYGDTSASSRYHMLEIAYSFDIGANLSFASPAGARATWDFDRTDFYGTLDFSSADVQGLYLTFS